MSYDPIIAPYDDLCSDVLEYRRDPQAFLAAEARRQARHEAANGAGPAPRKKGRAPERFPELRQITIEEAA